MLRLTRVAVTAPVLPVVPNASAHSPTFTAESVAVTVWVNVVAAVVVTVAGVVLVEATKQIYAKPAAVRVPKRRLVYTPAHSGM